MTPNDLHQLWQDAIGDVPTEAIADPLWQHTRQELRSRSRRQKLGRAALLAVAMLVSITTWNFWPHQRPEIARTPEPVPTRLSPPAPHVPPPVTPNPVAPQQVAVTPAPPEPTPPPAREVAPQIVIQSVPLKEFLAQLPHHGYMTIENQRGRFLVLVDHETGETVTTQLTEDDRL